MTKDGAEFEWEPLEEQNALMVIPQTQQMPMPQFVAQQQVPAIMPAMQGNQMYFQYPYPSGQSSQTASLIAWPIDTCTDYGFTISVEGRDVPSILPDKSILEGMTEMSPSDLQHFMSWLMWDDILQAEESNVLLSRRTALVNEPLLVFSSL